jgi:hypothetical protein
MGNGIGFHLMFPNHAVTEFVTIPIISDQCTLTVIVWIRGIQRILVIDSGSSYCTLQQWVSKATVKCTSVNLFGITGDNPAVNGKQKVSFHVREVICKHIFLASEIPTHYNAVSFKKHVRYSKTTHLRKLDTFLYKVRCKREHHTKQSEGKDLSWNL